MVLCSPCVVCCVVLDVCWSLGVGRCRLFVVCCMLVVCCCLLGDVYGLLFVCVRLMLFVVYCL